MILEPGETLAGYRIESVLGIGGMGVVYEATQLSLDRRIALKVLATTLVGNHSFRERFRREGRIAAALEHPHIVPVFEAGETNGLMFLAMRLIDGGTLADRIMRAPLTAAAAVSVLGKIASALDAAHRAELIHRDVKPHNILLSRESWPFLADFGVTKGTSRDGLTHTGDFVGTITYASPEQIRNESLTGACDVYALAGVLFTCLTGSPPFTSDGQLSLMYAHLHAPPPKLAALGLDVPDSLDDVFARGLAKDPAERFASSTELIAATDRALGELGADALARTPCLPLPKTAPPRHEEDSEIAASRVRVRVRAATEQPAGAEELTAADRRRPQLSTDAPVPVPVVRSALAGAAATAAGAPAARALPDPDRTSADRRRPVPAAPPPPAARRSRPHPLVLALGAILLVAAPVVGYLVGRPAATKSTRASTGVLALSYDGDWRRARGAAAAIEGLTLRDAVELRGPHGTKLAAGLLTSPRGGPDPAPAALLARLRAPSAPAPIAVRRLQTLRYAAPLKAGGRLWLAFVPTTLGWVAVGCESAAPGVSLDARCAQRAATLALAHGHALPVLPTAAAVAAVHKALGALARARHAAREGLGATIAKRRASAAQRLASAQERAARAIARAPGGLRAGAALKELARALTTGSKALRSLAVAARAAHRLRYDRARRRVRSSDGAAERALAALRRAGYVVSAA